MAENESVNQGSGPGSLGGRGRTNIKGNRTDIGWRYGSDYSGNGKKVRCSFCAKVISGGIFRFKHHLAGTSEDSEPCAQVSDEVRLTMLKIVASLKDTSTKKRKMTGCSDEWWDMYGDYTPELKKFAIRVLSLTCSSSGCERNWSAFEMVHTKKRNRLHQQKMNDLVYVMANMRLTKTEIRKRDAFEFEFVDIESDDEFLISGDMQVVDESGNEGGAGAARADFSANPLVPPSGDMLFGPNIEDPLSSEEEFDQAERDDDGDDRFSF